SANGSSPQHSLLGTAYFLEEDYASAAREFEEALALEQNPEARVKISAQARLARANDGAWLAGVNPEPPEFDPAEALAPPAITDRDLPDPGGRAPRSPERVFYEVAGRVLGKAVDMGWKML